jgi:hypothetical protein
MDHLEQQVEWFSDLHKEVYGCRPVHSQYNAFINSSAEERHEIIHSLTEQVQTRDAEEMDRQALEAFKAQYGRGKLRIKLMDLVSVS